MNTLRQQVEKAIEDKVHLPGAEQVLLRLIEAQELVNICAKDIVDAWPQTSMRTLGQMTKRMDTLRQALEAAGK
jgi:hypothetical protein